MSGLSETEILAKHKQSLGEAKTACQELARNLDPLYLAPRGRHYRLLRTALTELEGSCRQMAAFRDDTRWTKLGFVYARTLRLIQKKFTALDWGAFRDLVMLFDNGLTRMDDLATRKTGRLGPILPQRTDWLILPDNTPKPSLWTPQGRLMN